MYSFKLKNVPKPFSTLAARTERKTLPQTPQSEGREREPFLIFSPFVSRVLSFQYPDVCVKFRQSDKNRERESADTHTQDDDYVLPHQRFCTFDVLVCPLSATERFLL